MEALADALGLWALGLDAGRPLYEALFVKLLVAPFLLVLIRAVPRLGRFDDHRR
jgi:hypothetical protein